MHLYLPLRITFCINTVPLPPPTDVKLVEANHTHFRFTWSHVSSCYPSIQYHIVASNCGECPATTHSNMLTCSRNHTQLTSDHSCSFAVGTAVCNDTVGNISITINIPTAPAGMDISTRHTYRPVLYMKGWEVKWSNPKLKTGNCLKSIKNSTLYSTKLS